MIKCAICKDTESIEVFASGNDPGDITGLLAEIGRNLTKEFERLGKVQPVFNIHIKDSIIQRSNLLSFCDLDGTCGGDVVIEDSVVQRANIASWNEGKIQTREERKADEKLQVQYWITTSNWYDRRIASRPCSGAFDRLEKQIWWYYKGRDNVRIGDKAVIYQPGGDVEAGKEKITIDEKVKVSFIGNFTVDKIIERNDSIIPDICWTESYDGWLRTVETDFLWPQNKVIKRKNIDDDLLLKITKSPNIGLVFKGKTWIKITKEYYDLVLEEQKKLYKEDKEQRKIVAREEQERNARDEAEKREHERQRTKQEEERIIKEREELSDIEKKKGFSQIKFLAVALVLGVLLLGYWILAPGALDASETIKSTPAPTSTTKVTPTVAQTILETSTVPSTPAPTPVPGQKTFINSIGMEFVLISAGEFDMGSSGEIRGYNFEAPIHRVNFSKAFYMGKYEVTQKQWQEVMGNNPSFSKGDNLPVEQVSWNDVQEFIKKLNENEGTDKYRLPSEAEWEYAARAGTMTRYSFGNDESNLGDYAWYGQNSGRKTHEVGQKKPNPWGLYDMHGNVWESVQDIYQKDYNGAPTDGSSWEKDGSLRVNRGGSMFDDALSLRSANRNDASPDYRYIHLGFRLVRIL